MDQPETDIDLDPTRFVRVPLKWESKSEASTAIRFPIEEAKSKWVPNSRSCGCFSCTYRRKADPIVIENIEPDRVIADDLDTIKAHLLLLMADVRALRFEVQLMDSTICQGVNSKVAEVWDTSSPGSALNGTLHLTNNLEKAGGQYRPIQVGDSWSVEAVNKMLAQLESIADNVGVK